MAEPDVQHFLDEVDEVSRLIDGLKSGALSPDYVDGKVARQGQKQLSNPAPPSPSDIEPRDAHKPAAAGIEDEARAAELQRKAQELKNEYARKIRARQRYLEHVSTQGTEGFSTDYTKWELWEPEDETDELISSISSSSNPALRAMERDIEERHKR
jgi:hypothetical protein